jgi:hypothetical protein
MWEAATLPLGVPAAGLLRIGLGDAPCDKQIGE